MIKKLGVGPCVWSGVSNCDMTNSAVFKLKISLKFIGSSNLCNYKSRVLPCLDCYAYTVLPLRYDANSCVSDSFWDQRDQ